MSQKLLGFLKSETGAVTVDWVVLTAAIVGLGVLVVYPIITEIHEAGETVGTDISLLTPGYKNY